MGGYRWTEAVSQLVDAEDGGFLVAVPRPPQAIEDRALAAHRTYQP